MAEKIKVLMVDDEEKFRETTARLLTRKGFYTTIAGTGEEAMDIIRDNPQDVVVLDIRMPGMDGHEALKRIREIQPDVQIIMLTGHGGSDSAKLARDRGAFDYLNKPCDVDLLASKIIDAHKARVFGDDMDIREKSARDIMIHIADYTRINERYTVAQAIAALKKSFEGFMASSRLMETGHRSVLVFDDQNELAGILSIQDLIAGVRPAYLTAPKPSTADSVQFSPLFWEGLFKTQVRAMAHKPVSELMSDPPISVDGDTKLMEIADLMIRNNTRRIVVTEKGRVIGVVREQELFFEMANIIL